MHHSILWYLVVALIAWGGLVLGIAVSVCAWILWHLIFDPDEDPFQEFYD